MGRLRYTDHLEIMREAGFCYRWHAGDTDRDPFDDGICVYLWTSDQRVETNSY